MPYRVHRKPLALWHPEILEAESARHLFYGRPRRGGAAAARRRRPACGLRSRSTCRRARCSTTRDIWGCSGGSDILHYAHHLCAGRRCGATARRADACAAKQRAARVDEQPCVSTKLLHVEFSGFVMRHARACAARLADVHAGRVHVLRWPGRLLFACGDYFLLKVRATARTRRMPEHAHVLTAP